MIVWIFVLLIMLKLLFDFATDIILDMCSNENYFHTFHTVTCNLVSEYFILFQQQCPGISQDQVQCVIQMLNA